MCSPTWFWVPLFADEDIVKEKQVILEEIRMEDDNPESLAHEIAHPKLSGAAIPWAPRSWARARP